MTKLNLRNTSEKEAYIDALIIIAKADGKITEEEREFIESRSSLLDVEVFQKWDNDYKIEDLLKINEISYQTKVTIIYDCIFLGHIDGYFDKDERLQVYNIAKHLGLPKQNVDEINNWLLEYKSVLEKGQLIMGYSLTE